MVLQISWTEVEWKGYAERGLQRFGVLKEGEDSGLFA